MTYRSMTLILCLAACALADPRTLYPRSEPVTEKRFEFATADGDPYPFCLNTTNGNLWKLSPETMEWRFYGDLRRANSGPKGTYRLLPGVNGEAFVVHTENGKAWWTDGTEWLEVDEPSTRMKKTKLSARDRLKELD